MTKETAAPRKGNKIEVLFSADVEWYVILFNCYCHFLDEAVEQIVKATGCRYSMARMQALYAHNNGSVIVFSGSYEDCIKVANVLRAINLEASITQGEG